MFPPTLITGRLALRPLSSEDAAAIFERYAADPEVTRFMSWATHATVDDTHKFLAMAPEPGDTHWAICVGEDPLPSGTISAFVRGHAVEIGYVLSRSHWGQGLMTEAAQAVIDLAWREPTVWRVHAHAHVDNTASQRVLEKCGLSREGVARRAARLPAFGDTPQDAVMYSQVRDNLDGPRDSPSRP